MASRSRAPALAQWYAANGRHELAWRATRDRWALLVAEVMLHQTQVARVEQMWPAFMAKFPDPETTARAGAGAVIAAWERLGYPRRARWLWEAAVRVHEHGWPDDLTELPGVGPYTAAAVGNFAFGREVLPVDTNVRRVQERSGGSFDHECAQALFDLGATVCLARVPRCGVCPLVEVCPSRGRRYEPLRKQSPFAGSFRERRAKALRAVAAGLAPDDDEAVASLARDGLVVLTAAGAALPS